MKLYVCSSCGSKFFEERMICAKCRSVEFYEKEFEEKEVISETTLTSTPAGFPDTLLIRLIRVDGVTCLVGDVKQT
ncbi:hypothetical protein B9Q13_02640 [Candidatus Marsarchaeota G2 archaeon ECH_B_SAG-G16]|uniref:DUF35 domain-containing protein n=6 Tax=Candidatus Marsarchaeota TaxID=1978152 RepID=A0A2R6C3G7_9ARCH|nr:MAG: hypothetical protein B9Q01_06915 [Candidatus Marsarchaeota G1 archaeon OSP_D]PSN86396.1 MAG: hypothetical protein B9Q02_02585 [Candidatus Marsarchaeota G1 archaeon BE_D]PSN87634.1 MAG: hypothetical protein B9Q00_08235 [Candidatus Marsarchaeota G1 archaeon OSP_C]PSN93807.1 MAG: hypothetical protein B9P99_02120 [Candidatus Marsarchaeota G1 archaeon OSP_B]PSO05160.1 MAG: hypothetical protein B9Q13_02640 [Candidatus Marsarchaeota G2 archaeon ECH_B_SAG-G16]PSO05409.1 MAG: hypothetical prote